MSGQDASTTIHQHRPRLIRIAYRMLGSVADAEDVVQEAYLRWHGGGDRTDVLNAEAYLSRTVTHLCLNHLNSARHRRETYIGPWLPDPVFDPVDGEGEDVTLPLMLALERLSPLERAAFLLHDVFGVSFDEIARAIDREPAACRQLASRARVNVRAARTRFSMSKERGREIATAFFAASRNGDLEVLRSLLAADVAVYADGGGKTRASPEPVFGLDAVVRLHASLAGVFAGHMSRLLRYGTISGLPGFMTVERGEMLQTTALQIEADKIAAIYVVQNPDKLSHLMA